MSRRGANGAENELFNNCEKKTRRILEESTDRNQIGSAMLSARLTTVLSSYYS